VFDWNRVGLDGKARELHIQASLACIDFSDFEPGLVSTPWQPFEGGQRRRLVSDPLFSVDAVSLEAGGCWLPESGRCWIVGVTQGAVQVSADGGAAAVELGAGQFCLVPAVARGVKILASGRSGFLQAAPGVGSV
jgi:mannose-6-phosphate isomerase